MNGPIGICADCTAGFQECDRHVLLEGPGALGKLELCAGTGKRFLQALATQLQFPAACVYKTPRGGIAAFIEQLIHHKGYLVL